MILLPPPQNINNHYQPPFEYMNSCNNSLSFKSVIQVYRLTHPRYEDAPLTVLHHTPNRTRTTVGITLQYQFKVKHQFTKDDIDSRVTWIKSLPNTQTPQRYDEIQETDRLSNNGGIHIRN